MIHQCVKDASSVVGASLRRCYVALVTNRTHAPHPLSIHVETAPLQVKPVGLAAMRELRQHLVAEHVLTQNLLLLGGERQARAATAFFPLATTTAAAAAASRSMGEG